jgi:hypothetical protein
VDSSEDEFFYFIDFRGSGYSHSKGTSMDRRGGINEARPPSWEL